MGRGQGEGKIWHNNRLTQLNMKPHHRIYPPILQRVRELRQTQTPAESTLWRALRNRNLVYKFRRQHAIDHFIVDFYCPQVKLCIEVDGSTHYEAGQHEYDLARTTFLEELGCTLIRFTNDDVRDNINAVIDEIIRIITGLVNGAGSGQGEDSQIDSQPNPLPSP